MENSLFGKTPRLFFFRFHICIADSKDKKENKESSLYITVYEETLPINVQKNNLIMVLVQLFLCACEIYIYLVKIIKYRENNIFFYTANN